MDFQTIIELFHKLLTKENITFALSVFGSLGTAYTLLSQRKKISGSIHYYRYENKGLVLYMSFTNHSHQPISISNVAIVHDSVCYPCVYVPTKVYDSKDWIKNELISHKEIFSISFPISLTSLAGSSGYLYFDTLPDNFPTSPKALTFEVSTSRGKAKRMILSVPN